MAGCHFQGVQKRLISSRSCQKLDVLAQLLLPVYAPPERRIFFRTPPRMLKFSFDYSQDGADAFFWVLAVAISIEDGALGKGTD